MVEAQRITREKLKESIQRDTSLTEVDFDIERKQHELNRDRTEAYLAATERQEVIKMRSRWSNWILGVIVGISVFDVLLVFWIGRGFLVFTNSYAIPLFVGESLVKLLGLAFLIVHFLFDHKSMHVSR